MLIPRADWRDTYAYGPDGAPAGWTRHRADRDEAFTADGRRILEPGAAGGGRRAPPPSPMRWTATPPAGSRCARSTRISSDPPARRCPGACHILMIG